MNLNTLKAIYNRSPFWLKRMVSHLPDSMLIGREYAGYCKYLKEGKLVSEEDIFLKVKETVSFAYNNIAYYKKEYDKVGFNINDFKCLDDLKKLPTINKEIIRDNFEDFINSECKKSFYVTTGGSSGEPMKFLQSSNIWSKECAFVQDFFGKQGYSKKNLKVTFRGGEFGDNFYLYNPINNELHFSPFHLNSKTISSYVEVLNKYKPQFFHGYPSAIRALLELMKDYNVLLDFNVKAIFLISENIDPEDIIDFESFFNCKVTSFYGHSERLVFAPFVKCENDKILYKNDNRYGYFYLINGEMIATGFDNYAMPLINYCTGDNIESINKNGEFNVQGRWDKEYIVGKDDEKISLTALNFHSNLFENVVSFQYYQNRKGYLVIHVIPKVSFGKADIELILESHRQKIGQLVEVEVSIVEELLLSNRGKSLKLVKEL